ncbi:unnamed protein product [Polarella glacialis]|uniref:Uncharacterized protein n=1 Tax=Polarella glacialis TaxID=89957 RepID=A0A813D9P3_POLGL|nr:unnamed protein product [Polarella glacialis]
MMFPRLTHGLDIAGGGIDHFPFALTLCRPRSLNFRSEERRPVFAVVAYGSESCYVTSWPCLSLPFRLELSGKLLIRVVTAQDEVALLAGESGGMEELGRCELHLDRLPELFPGQLLGDGGASSFGHASAPAELWLTFEQGQDSSFELSQAGTPRMCVFVQARHNVSSAMFAMVRLGGRILPSAAAGNADAAPSPPVEGPAGPGSSPIGLDALAASIASAQPQSHGSSEVERWQRKFETEQQRTEELEQRNAAEINAVLREADLLGRKLERLIDLVFRRRLQYVGDMCFDAWCEWVAREKCERQFDQLSIDLEDFRKLRHQTMSQVSQDSAAVDKQITEVGLQAQGQERRWNSSMTAAEVRLAAEASFAAQEACFLFWRQALRQATAVSQLLAVYVTVSGRELLHGLLAAWRAEVGEESLIALTAKLRRSEQTTMKLAGQKAVSQLDRTLSRRASLVLIAEGFDEWARFARMLANRRARTRKFAGYKRRDRSLDAVLLGLCVALWHGFACQAERRVLAEQVGHQTALQRRRSLSVLVLRAACEGSAWETVRSALLCWRSHAAHGALQHSLEAQHVAKESAQGELGREREELQGIQAALHTEETCWAAERGDLLERLQHLEAELEEGEFTKRLQQVSEELSQEQELLDQELNRARVEEEEELAALRASESAEELDAARLEDAYHAEITAASGVRDEIRAQVALRRKQQEGTTFAGSPCSPARS